MATSCVMARVNGSMLASYAEKPVSIFGKVLSLDPNCLSFKIESSDAQPVNVTLRKPLAEDISGGLVEVRGISQGKNAVLCLSYILFPSDMAQSYDTTIEDIAIVLSSNIPNPWK